MPFATQRFGTFHLPPGCSAISELFSLHSSDSAYTRPEEDWTTVSAFPIDTLQMLDGMDLSELKAILAETEDNRITITRVSLDDAQLKNAKVK